MNGCVKWRVHTIDTECIVLNDYDVESSDLKKDDFVHTWRFQKTDGDILWDCSCEGYRLLQDVAKCQYESHDWTGFKCHHCSFMEEIYLHNLVRNTTLLNSYHDYS